MIREIGPRLHTAFRKARVAAWRFKRSPEQQDRAAMVATFAFIGLFAVGSVDAIITGGADFAPRSAYAAEYTPARMTPEIVAPVVEAPVVEEATVETALKAAGEIDYSFTTEVLLGGPEEIEMAVAEPEDMQAGGFTLEGMKNDASEPSAGVKAEEPVL